MQIFLPINQMQQRVAVSKNDSDFAYFFDLLLLGEMMTKITALFLVANIDDDVDRTRYRYEYNLVRAGGIGDFANAINDTITGSAATFLSPAIRDKELKELSCKAELGKWQRNALDNLSQCLDAFDIQYNKVTPKSALKIWFSNFATLRNKTKGHGAPTSKICSQVCPLLEESINLIFENLYLFKRPWAFLHQNYSRKYRVSDLGVVSNAFDYLKRENKEQYTDGIYCYTDHVRLIKLIYSDQDLSKFLLPNGNFNSNNQFEVLEYINDQKNMIDGSEFLTPPTKLPDSITNGKRNLDVIHNSSFSNLPTGIPDYIKREELETELENKLHDKDRFPVITLKGRGGIGKTSLAIYVVNKIAKSSRFDIIVWFSARDVDLFVDGPKQVQAAVLNQKDISKEYFNLISSDSSKIKNPIEDFSKELSLNSAGSALYIFDNFETITNPIEVFEWLNTYIRLPNKILITSRLSRNFKADYPIEVKGMSEKQCRELINATAHSLNIESYISNSYQNKLIEESDGHPYIIKIILGEVARAQKPMDVRRIVADKDNILDALFKRTFATLSSAAKRIFLTLCSWRSVIPQLALEAVILQEENEKIDIESAIEELNKSSFIELLEEKGEVFISVPLAATLYGNTELEVYPEKLQILRDKKYLMEFGAGNTKGLAGNLVIHIDKKFKSVGGRVKSLSQLEKEMPVLEYIASRYAQAWIFIADLYNEYGDREKEKWACREFIKATNSNDKKAECWQRLADICKSTGDWNGESSALSGYISLPNTPYNAISYAAWRVNNYYTNYQASIEKDTKTLLIENIIQVMERRICEADANDYSRLAWLYLNMNDETKALKYAKLGCDIDPTNQFCVRLCEKLSAV